MKTTYRFDWRSLSLWRQRTWSSSGTGHATTFLAETKCLFCLRHPKTTLSKATR